MNKFLAAVALSFIVATNTFGIPIRFAGEYNEEKATGNVRRIVESNYMLDDDSVRALAKKSDTDFELYKAKLEDQFSRLRIDGVQTLEKVIERIKEDLGTHSFEAEIWRIATKEVIESIYDIKDMNSYTTNKGWMELYTWRIISHYVYNHYDLNVIAKKYRQDIITHAIRTTNFLCEKFNIKNI